MAERIRFPVDESADSDIARGLRRHGLDVTTAQEAGLLGESDEAHLAFAKRENRVIVTHDADFLALAAQHPDHPGIAYCHRQRRSLGQIIRTLILMAETLTPEEMRGRVQHL